MSCGALRDCSLLCPVDKRYLWGNRSEAVPDREGHVVRDRAFLVKWVTLTQLTQQPRD